MWDATAVSEVVGRRSASPAALAAWLFMSAVATTAMGQLKIDTFAVPGAAGPAPSPGAVAQDIVGVMGGERDLESVTAGNDCTILEGIFRLVGSTQFNGCVVEYDGNDNDPVNPTIPGFAPVDFTQGGSLDHFDIATTVAAGSCSLLVQICDDQANCNFTAPLMSTGTRTVAYSPYSNAGVDMTKVTFILLSMSPQSVPADCSIGMLAPPPFADGFETGDTSAWSATVGGS